MRATRNYAFTSCHVPHLRVGRFHSVTTNRFYRLFYLYFFFRYFYGRRVLRAMSKRGGLLGAKRVVNVHVASGPMEGL